MLHNEVLDAVRRRDTERRKVEVMCTCPAGADVELGLVALEISTGDVLYSQFQDNAMRTEMEAQLLFTAPREVLQVHLPSMHIRFT